MCQLPGYSYRPYGCFPSPRPYPSPWLNRDHRYHGNLPDQNVGSGRWRLFPFCRDNTKGYVIDGNNNGRYDRGRDGVLVFDYNRDGKYDKKDVESTNNMMKAARGDYDFNGDGHVSLGERLSGSFYRNRFNQLDRNRDGRLETWEISQGGGKVWVDQSRDGNISRNELNSPYNIPGNWWEGSRRLDYVDPRWGSRTSTNSPWWERPCCGGVRPQPYFYGNARCY